MNLKLLLLPLLVVFLSGCINPGGGNGFVGSDEVVKIVEMVSQSSILSSDVYTLTIRAKNADTKLTNPPVSANIILSHPTCDVDRITPSCPTESTAFGADQTTGWGCNGVKLYPIGDAQTGERLLWDVNFKESSKGIKRSCGFDLVTTYEWVTSSLTNIQFRNDVQTQEIKEPAKGTGPVKVYFKVEEEQPIKVRANKFSINLYIDNVRDSENENILNDQITIMKTDVATKLPSIECIIGGTKTQITDGMVLSAKNKVIPCTADIVQNDDSFDVSLEAKYTYEITQKTPDVEVSYI